MAVSNYVLQKVGIAFRGFLKANAPIADIPATSITAGVGKEKKKASCIYVYATTAQAVDQESGNQLVSVSVVLQSNWNDTTEDEHHARLTALSNLVSTDTIAADLTAVLADFTVFLVTPSTQTFGVDDPHWMGELGIEIHCCGSDIS